MHFGIDFKHGVYAKCSIITTPYIVKGNNPPYDRNRKHASRHYDDNDSKQRNNFYQQRHDPRLDKVCFEFWKDAVCTKRNCNSIHKPLTWDEPLETVTRYFYHLLDANHLDESIEIYHCLLTKGETSTQKKPLTDLILTLLNANYIVPAFNLVTEIERLKLEDPRLFFKLLTACTLLLPEHKQLRNAFINYIIMTDIQMEPQHMREALDNIAMLPDKTVFWNFLLFATKQNFHPSSMTCTMAIEALVEEKFHITWVLKLFLKMARVDLYQVNSKNVEFLREMTKVFCISQNLIRLDMYLEKFGIRLGPVDIRDTIEQSPKSNESGLTMNDLGMDGSCDEKMWSRFLRLEQISEEDFNVLMNGLTRNPNEVAAKFESFYSFAKTRISIEDPSNLIGINAHYWFTRLAIELILTCYQQMQLEEAFKILTTARKLRVNYLEHHSIKRTELVLAIIQICLGTGNEYVASDILKESNERFNDYVPLMLGTTNTDELATLQFISTSLQYHQSGAN
uniref:Uncharacterized protein n=1 Tax=Strigamia maritima TaxID=126957 RepID=T1JBV3_STRMM